MSEHCPSPLHLEELHGDTPVAFIGITMLRSGMMKIEGSITDEHFARHMLDTARDTLTNYHIQQKAGRRSSIIVHANDTALVGTPQEKALLAARDDLDNAYRGR